MTSISLTKLNSLLGNKFETYKSISFTYFLPQYASKAITVDYLSKYIFAKPGDPSIYMVLRKNLVLVQLLPTRESFYSPDLLEKLDLLLRSKNLPETGLTLNTLPDGDWVLRVLHNLDPNEDEGIFGDRTKLEDFITRNLNPA